MLWFLGGLFLAVNLLIRVPVRIGLKINPNNEKLGKIDLIALIATGIIFIALIACALIEGEVESGLATACIIVFGGAMMMIIVPLSLASIKERRYWVQLYNQTNQRPYNEDYGFSRENPIWSGTCEYYMEHLIANSGENFKWKYSKKIDLPKDNGIVKVNGIYGCEMHKIKIIFNEDKIDTIYIITKAGLNKMKTWHAPKGYKFV
jgi:hypothetical protein